MLVNRIVLLFVLMFVFSLESYAKTLQVDSKIKAVMVYPSGAKITRSATFSLAKGEQDISLINLPINLQQDSLRVSGESEATVRLGSVNLRRDVKRDVVLKREKELRKTLRLLKSRHRQAVDLKQRFNLQLDFIRAIGIGDKTGEPTGYQALSVEQWEEAWQTLDVAVEKAQRKIRDAERSIINIEEDIEQTEYRLQHMASGEKESLSALLSANSEEKTRLTITIHYQISGAQWSPVYDAELDSEHSTLALKTLALVQQSTGEDWDKVKMTVSTLRPAAGLHLPKLKTKVVRFAPEMSYVAPSAASSGLRSRSVAPAAPPEAVTVEQEKAGVPLVNAKPIIRQQSDLISTSFSAEYSVPDLVSLPSGADYKQRLLLSEQSLATQLQLASVPRIDPRALLIAKMTYKGEALLLPGQLALYRDGRFIGNDQLPQVQSGERFDLSFGEDDRVAIRFLPTPETQSESGLLSKRELLHHDDVIEITNHHKTPKEIILYDQLPIAAHEDIVVTLHRESDQPSQRDVDDEQGVFAWQRSLEPETPTKIRFAYSISYPKDRRLQSP